MYFVEQESSESDVLMLIQEAVHDPENNELRTLIIDPMIKVLETPSGRNSYIELGNEFLEANAEMLSKEFPTKPVTFPRRYVDRVFEIFGFEVKSLKEIIKKLLSEIGNSNFNIIENPTNIIHSVVLFYADMIINKKLRDSARHQLGLSLYQSRYKRFFPGGFINEATMSYTFMSLSGKWTLVKSENMINWIGMTIETSYQFWRTKLTINMSISVMASFLDRSITAFNQNLRLLSNLYYKNADDGNMNGSDLDGSEDYVVTNNFITLRDNLLRLIKSGDSLYSNKSSNLYSSVGRLKNVKVESLYEFSQKIKHIDIAKIIDGIFYVFLVKEGNKVEEINSTKYMSRITNFPTAVDRAIQGRPIILPLTKKYEADSNIVKAYICLIATFILLRINDINQPE